MLYFFDTDDGEIVHEDNIGTELGSEEDARREGLMALAELAKEYLPTYGPGRQLVMTVRNAEGLAFLELVLSLNARSLNPFP